MDEVDFWCEGYRYHRGQSGPSRGGVRGIKRHRAPQCRRARDPSGVRKPTGGPVSDRSPPDPKLALTVPEDSYFVLDGIRISPRKGHLRARRWSTGVLNVENIRLLRRHGRPCQHAVVELVIIFSSSSLIFLPVSFPLYMYIYYRIVIRRNSSNQ